MRYTSHNVSPVAAGLLVLLLPVLAAAATAPQSAIEQAAGLIRHARDTQNPADFRQVGAAAATALAADPQNAVAHCGKALVALYKLQSSNVTMQQNRAGLIREAGEECNKALDIDSNVAEVHYTLGLVHKEEGSLKRPP